ncbi:hypothetical protein EUTSA_v10009983mg, partial [Eutrema salsugineum]
SSLSPLNLPYLPDDLLLNCFARISRLYYPALSLVSKRFRSLLTSLELHKTRTLLSRSESCLYVCLPPTRVSNPNPNTNPKTNWFTSCFRPFRNKERKPSEYLLVSVATSKSSLYSPSLTTVGHYIYMIGIDINGNPSRKVFFLDCRCHTWYEAPIMRIAKEQPHTNCFSVEVFDPKTQIWEYFPSPSVTIVNKILAIKGNLYVLGDKHVVYMPKENRWYYTIEGDTRFIYEMSLVGFLESYCEIDNVIHSYRFGKVLEWYDYEEQSWKVLKGLKKLYKLSRIYGSVRLVNYGGKIMVSWIKNVHGISDEKMIRCAEIALERRSKHKIYGKVEWCDVLLSVPDSFLYHGKVFAATV